MSIFVRSAPVAETRNAEAVMAAALRSAGLASDRAVSQSVTPDAAMKHSGVAACVLTINNLALLEPHAHREVDGMQVRVADPPLLREPSAHISPLAWRHQVYDAWCRRGTAFGIVAATDQHLYPTQVELIPAEHVTVRMGRNRALRDWTWKVDGQVVEPWPNGNLWIAPGLHTRTGVPVGISPIEMALGAIRLGLAAEDFGTSWFLDGAVPSGVVYSDKKLDDTTASSIKAKVVAALNGRREPLVLGAGMKYEKISVAANESQFLETLDRNMATVARFFLMPPEEIGASSGNSMTYSNQEAKSIALLTKTYGPWIALMEQTLNVCTPRPQKVLLDESTLLRLDKKTQAEIDDKDLRNGARSQEEVRRGRNLGPVAEGDHVVWPPGAKDAPIPEGDQAKPGGPT